MDQTRIRPGESSAVMADLARIALAAERRLLRLERLLRWTAALFLLTLMLALYALSQAFGAPTATAQLGWPHVAPEPTHEQPGDPVGTGERMGAADPALEGRLEELRARLGAATAEDMNPFHLIALVLHDLRGVMQENQRTLAVIPDLVEEMRQMRGDVERVASTLESMDGKLTGVPVMAEEMRRLNVNIDIMTTSIDSTMGRMGRMMPYMW